MTKIKSYFARLIDWVWREPKSNISGKIRKVCDDMPHKQRLTVVTVLLSAFILTAFFVFGHACYKMGEKRAVFEYEVEHIHEFDLPAMKLTEYPKEEELRYNNQSDSAYESRGVESEY